ncbi:MAG: T9SS type A sorting domain-containing protein, partial [Saprospiraceae bacterium]|nr:T9SS type A sorting domain-containing protein [Saprospiraceae bacterium]
IYPNPSGDVINLRAQEDITGVQIYNMSGKLITTLTTFGQPNQTIDISDFIDGMYILRIETEENVYTEKFVKR